MSKPPEQPPDSDVLDAAYRKRLFKQLSGENRSPHAAEHTRTTKVTKRVGDPPDTGGVRTAANRPYRFAGGP